MSKQGKKQRTTDEPLATQPLENAAADTVVEVVETVEVETVASEAQQAVESSENIAKETEKETAFTPETNSSDAAETAPVAKSGGKGIALLALFVALAVGGLGYYVAGQKFGALEQQLQQVQNTPPPTPLPTIELSNFEQEKQQLANLNQASQHSLARLQQLEQQQLHAQQQINALQEQLQKLGAAPKLEQTVWLLSDADFLLNNALRKMVLDNDVDTAKSLLIEADNVLSQVQDPKVISVRDAIKIDLNQLSSLNEVDQNSLMQRLAQLANLVDDMPLLDNEAQTPTDNDQVSDSIADWKQNLERSAGSFLNHFIRVSDKKSEEKAFIAPNQEIYLRENIRLRLQIAILTVPRQQNELYKQSLEAVSTWVRSYFDPQNENVQNFLSEVDGLMEQSIYVDAPTHLQSLRILEQLLNKPSKPVEKIQLESEKSLEQLKVENATENTATPEATPSDEQPASAQ